VNNLPAFAKDYNGNLSIGQILLVTKISVGGDEHLEPGSLGGVQQFAITKDVRGPSELWQRLSASRC
jgi:hypothetical protein